MLVSNQRSMSLAHNTIRNDIQGLRAIAVGAVVLFHINDSLLPGGYIGVDIFFVISGFLITKIIWRDFNAGQFAFAEFYSKRIKRLFPAMFGMLVGTTVLALMFSLPEETMLYGKSLASTIFYVSNYFFYSQSGYFSSDLQLSPLLHTWSLGVEEQYYLVFPLLLWAIYRWARRFVIPCLIMLFVTSLLLSEWLIAVDESLSFYSTPTRFFQFLLGGTVALAGPNVVKNRMVNEILNLIGLFGIAWYVLRFSSYTPFPGFNALYPSICTALVLYAGSHPGLLTSALISIQPARFFGNISYSLYLWHWPVIVFYKMQIPNQPGPAEQLGLLVASIVLGWLSWRFIENPFRNSQRLFSGARRVYGYALAGSLAFAGMGLFLYVSDGVSSRFSKEQRFFSGYIDYTPDRQREHVCFYTSSSGSVSKIDLNECVAFDNRKRNYLLLGDSHAAHYYSAFQEIIGEQETLSQINASGCKPTTGTAGAQRCVDLMELAFDKLVREYPFDTVILSAKWTVDDIEGIRMTIDYLSAYTDNIIILGPIITYKQALPRLLARSYANGEEGENVTRNRNIQQVSGIDSVYKQALAGMDVHYVSVFDGVCGDQVCDVVTPEKIPLQFDYGHLTHEGAVHLLNKLHINRLL